MSIIFFQDRGDAGPDEAWNAELEAALSGETGGPVAEHWRELREDVRALAPSMTPEFERGLRERIEAAGSPARKVPASTGRRAVRRLPRSGHIGAAGGALAALAAVAAALLIAAPWHSDTVRSAVSEPAQPRQAQSAPAESAPAVSEAVRPALKGPVAAPAVAGTSTPAPASPSGRVQQLAASITLAAAPNDIQETADRIGRLVASDEGFVQSSHVQVQQEGHSEATLTLKLPSAKLNAALASLGQLAPVRAESQSLQDITATYDAARQRLTDATAERQALLRALAAASTQGQIDSLRERLAANRGAIAQARSALEAVSRRGSTAEVEVTVAGSAASESNGLTVDRGLHDAGRVLVVTLAVLLIAVAVLVPLALLLIALIAGLRAWRRYRREQALDAS